MRISKLVIILLVSLVFLPFTSARAASLLPKNTAIKDSFAPGVGAPIGSILLSQGQAVLIHSGEKVAYRAVKDVALYKGDSIITMDRSRVRYKLNDDSVITMAANTRVVLSQCEYSEKKGRASFLKLDGGKARFLVKKLLKVKRSEFKVKTPTALVGVRGSDFIINASKTLTEVTTLKHTLLEVLSGAALDKAPMLLSDMQRTFVEKGSLPSDVENISQEEMESLHDEFAMGHEMRDRQPQGIRDGGGQRGDDGQDQEGDDSGDGGESTGDGAEASDDSGGESQDSGSEAAASTDTGETGGAAEASDTGGDAASQGDDTGSGSEPSSTDSSLKLEPQVNILVPVEELVEPAPLSVDPVVDTTTPVEQDIFKQLDVTGQDPDIFEEIINDTIQQQPTVTELPGMPGHP